MSEALRIDSLSVEHTVAVAAAVAGAARAGDVIGLVGELGAGKTQFVRGLAANMGIDPRSVSSPTFVFMQEYEPTDARGPVLVHIDAYRLHGPDDLASIGWVAEGRELRDRAVVAIEWVDLIAPALGADWLEVELQHASPGRLITLSPHGNWRAKMALVNETLKAQALRVSAVPQASE